MADDKESTPPKRKPRRTRKRTAPRAPGMLAPAPVVYPPPPDAGSAQLAPLQAAGTTPAGGQLPPPLPPPLEAPGAAPAGDPGLPTELADNDPQPLSHYRRVQNQFDEERKAEFLRYYAATGQHNKSAYAVGITPETVRQHRKKFPEFGNAVLEAYRDFQESLETEAVRRGRGGTLKPIFQKGMKVGEVREYSDTLLLEMLRRHIPEYRHRQQVDVNHTGGVLVVPEKAKDDAEFLTRFGGNPSHATN